jgi:hypothetical protein
MLVWFIRRDRATLDGVKLHYVRDVECASSSIPKNERRDWRPSEGRGVTA